MTKILKGKNISNEITNMTIEKLSKLKIKPKISILRIGEDPGDISYEKSIIKYTDKLGIDCINKCFSKDITQEDLIHIIESLNLDNSINGIMILRPLPNHIDEDTIANIIDPKKDIDCMNPLNLAEVFKGNLRGYLPCTAKSVMEILKRNNIKLEGSNVVIINRSVVVGKPLSMMLLKENATVTICHSKTRNLKDLTNSADIVVTAMGKAKLLNEDYFNENSIVIDVGMSLDENEKLSGDVDFDNVINKISAITPVLGGVGSITTSILINQLIMQI